MAAELGFLSLTQLQKLSQNPNHHHQPDTNLAVGSGMWYPKAQPLELDDDSWEVRAFAEDTGNVMGTTWPPRSYTCTFCGREFHSAQALGGHMNVHRHDRARLQKPHPGGLNLPSAKESATNGGMCLLYQLHNPNGVFTSPPRNARSFPPYPPFDLMAATATSINIPVPPPALNSSSSYITGSSNCKETSIEELDLELRLGHRRSTTS
ncbi:hypothetical protein F3Y22_tig00112159pilonHSYRG00100 [Hibiscus syriacus]|uniref:C2H2-type domain-containing protein n=1 Tax=Hibiscus syriacus TaxID=106335 RepID=A0A6A2XTV5_HIBSY|nr:zinc finger protein 10-like [Hibiscus syriacus]KAE8670255.1 hypothetical protein F3Y22_tig00112159pilonHSYRG00100 [Hibiscus syriacus]